MSPRNREPSRENGLSVRGDNSLFATVAPRFIPFYFNAEYARAHGHPGVVVDPLLVLCTL